MPVYFGFVVAHCSTELWDNFYEADDAAVKESKLYLTLLQVIGPFICFVCCMLISAKCRAFTELLGPSTLGCYVAILLVAIYIEAFEPIKDLMQEQLYYHCLTLYALYIGIFSNRFLAHTGVRIILYLLFEITIF